MSRSPSSQPARRSRLSWLLVTGLGFILVVAACGDLETPAFVDCTVAPDTLDFGDVTLGGSADRTFSVTNAGSEALEATIRPTCSDFAMVGSSSITVPKGESRTFTMRFSPKATGPRPCRISIGDCGVLTTQGRGLPGSSGCDVEPASLAFGTVTVGSTKDLTFTITNTGASQLSGTVEESCPEFSLVGSTDYDLAPNEDATFTVRFAPTSGGLKSCTIDAQGLCADVSVSGTGQAPAEPLCSVSVESLSFGTVTVGETATRTFTITNAGDGTLTGNVSESCSDFSIVGTSTYSLGAGQAATFTVRFAPTSEGLKSCTIDTQGLCADVSVSGTGQTPQAEPLCSVSVDSLSFGTVTVGETATRTFTITNAGGGTLTGSVSESCSNFSIVGTSSYSLGAGQIATFTVRFAPLVAGSQTCTIATGSSCDPVTARGTGGAPPTPSCQLDSTSIDFGDVTIGQIAARQVRVTNAGSGILSGSLSESCSSYSILGTTSYSLASLESATFTLQFAPTATGDFTCTVDAGVACGTITLRGSGVPPPECELSDTDYDFGEVEIGKHKDHAFDIRNVGGGQLCGTATESCESFAIQGGASYCAIPGTPFRLRIRFQPTATGSFQCTVNPGAGCPPITVRGVGR